MSSIDISPHDYETVLQILQKHVPKHDVLAFGSRVGFLARPASDLDLSIMTDQKMTLAALADLREAFSESNLPFKVDIVDWAAAEEYFRAIIAKNSVLIAPASK